MPRFCVEQVVHYTSVTGSNPDRRVDVNSRPKHQKLLGVFKFRSYKLKVLINR